MRKRIYEIIELNMQNRGSKIYHIVMLFIIILSLVPLSFKNTSKILLMIDITSTAIFIVDYVLRLITADYKYNGKAKHPFIKYPFSFMAIMDFLSIAPTFIILIAGYKALKWIKLLRFLRMFRIVRILKYSKNMRIILTVIEKKKEQLGAVLVLAVGYIFFSALVVFNVEPKSFHTFFDAIYWAAVSLTTVGYGDIYPVTVAGRVVTMLSTLVGVAVVALPSGIITVSYMEEINNE